MEGKRFNKYSRFMITEFKKIQEYKLDLLGKTLKPAIRVTILLLVWSAIFKTTGAETIGELNKNEFTTYIIIAMFLASTRNWWDMYEELQKYIKKGALTGILSRPLTFYNVIMAKMLPYTIAEMLVLVLTFAGVIGLSTLYGFTFHTPEITHALLFIISTILSAIAAITFYYLVCLAMFWFGDIWSLYGIFDGIEMIFSGALMPVTIQTTFNTASYFLPFRHFIFTPTFIYLEKYTLLESITQIGIQILWIIILWTIAQYIYNKGIQKFDSQGG